MLHKRALDIKSTSVPHNRTTQFRDPFERNTGSHGTEYNCRISINLSVSFQSVPSLARSLLLCDVLYKTEENIDTPGTGVPNGAAPQIIRSSG